MSGNAGLFLVAVAIAGVGYLVVNHHYLATSGRVEPTTGVKVQVGALSVLSAVAMGITITVDFQAQLPFSTFGTAFASSS